MTEMSPVVRLKDIAMNLSDDNFVELYAIAAEFEKAVAQLDSVREILLSVKGSSDCGLYAQSLERIAEVLDV